MSDARTGESDVTQPDDGGRFDGNRLATSAEDLFGFDVVANVVATALVERTGPDCVVIGIEGRWGSGKSTLLAMLEKKLEERGASVAPFAPWLIGSRDALLEQLFTALESAVASQRHDHGDATDQTVIAAKNGLAGFRRYSSAVGALGKAAGLAGVFVPGVGLAQEPLKQLSDLLGLKPEEVSLEKAKERTASALASLRKRVVILIDDLDRLEPTDAVEMLRLVQAVADFPNVSYALSYDRARLAHAIGNVLSTDGSAYLEKLVQVVMPLPKPQPTALVDMFSRRLKAVTGVQDFDLQLAELIAKHVGRIGTPRAVVRVLDSLRLLWPTLREQVHLTDLVWLQFVRAEDDRLYRWIEDYVGEAALVREDRTLADARERLNDALSAILGHVERPTADWEELQSFLPMVKRGRRDASSLLHAAKDKEVIKAFHERRLSSLEHSRLYFGLLPPDGRTVQKAFENLMSASADGVAVARILVDLSGDASRNGPPAVELVTDLIAGSLVQLDADQLAGLTRGLLTAIDDVLRQAQVADRRIFRAKLTSLMRDLFARQDSDALRRMLGETLHDRVAIDFLTNELSGGAADGDDAWLRDGAQADLLRSHLAKAYSGMRKDDLARWAAHSNVMSAWENVDPDGRARFLQSVLDNDELLTELVIGLHQRLVIEQQSMRDFGMIIFANEVEKLWGEGTVEIRLSELLEGAHPKSDRIRSALDTLRGD